MLFLCIYCVCFQHVQVEKSLCRHLSITTEFGDVVIDNLYADQLSLMTHSGNVYIRNAHRSVDIIIQQDGNIKIGKISKSYNHFFHFLLALINWNSKIY